MFREKHYKLITPESRTCLKHCLVSSVLSCSDIRHKWFTCLAHGHKKLFNKRSYFENMYKSHTTNVQCVCVCPKGRRSSGTGAVPFPLCLGEHAVIRVIAVTLYSPFLFFVSRREGPGGIFRFGDSWEVTRRQRGRWHNLRV